MENKSQHFDSELIRLMEEKPKISDAARNLLAQEMAQASSGAADFTQQELLAAIQQVLKRVRDYEMKDPVAWGVANPQSDAQTGVERMEQLLRYRAAYTLHRQCQNKQQSSCKLLGRSFLGLVWPEIDFGVGGDGEEEDESALHVVVRAFARSLQTSNATAGEEDSLVWAQDFVVAVAQRQKARVERGQRERERALQAEIMQTD